jgi:hypothetical protein
VGNIKEGNITCVTVPFSLFLLDFGKEFRSLFLEKLAVRIVILECNIILFHHIVIKKLG